uniref:Uncharacterized protein n=1 Tax=Podoviridae sp. ctaNW81 TaxID=2826562 RepID=A0A8S5M5B5_9CAUD|nr:MAG TPA: hypothetical protein [Podoviridae sp. ctaNW81]
MSILRLLLSTPRRSPKIYTLERPVHNVRAFSYIRIDIIINHYKISILIYNISMKIYSSIIYIMDILD